MIPACEKPFQKLSFGNDAKIPANMHTTIANKTSPIIKYLTNFKPPIKN